MKWKGCGSQKDFFYDTNEDHKTPQYILGLRIKSGTFLAGSKT
jgi:hypothetical protein